MSSLHLNDKSIGCTVQECLWECELGGQFETIMSMIVKCSKAKICSSPF
jgi:hypothetical protein